MIGCSKDHSKEIDLYDKTFGEKIERVKTMVDQAQKAYVEAMEELKDEEETKESIAKQKEENLQKASYYYQ